MKRCRTCKWWSDVSDDDYIPQIPNFPNHKHCAHHKVGGGTYNDNSRSGSDALNSYESVGTGPDFGCVHHDDRDR